MSETPRTNNGHVPAASATESTPGPFVKYMVRRETHSSRAGAALFFAILLLVVVIWLGTELVLDMAQQPALLLNGEQLFNGVGHFSENPVWAVLLVALVLLILGIIALAKAFGPGTLRKHSTGTQQRMAFIADDKVVAAALSEAVRRQYGFTAEQVNSSIYRTRAEIEITPSSGHPVNSQEIENFVQDTLNSYSLDPALRAQVKVSEQGMVA